MLCSDIDVNMRIGRQKIYYDKMKLQVYIYALILQ